MTTLPQLQALCIGMPVIEKEEMLKQRTVPYFKVPAQHISGGNE
jgi:hypothetical protein